VAKKIQKKDFKSSRELLWHLFLVIMANKKWWLLPILLMLILLSIFVNLTGNHAVLPAIYSLF